METQSQEKNKVCNNSYRQSWARTNISQRNKYNILLRENDHNEYLRWET